VKQDNVAGRERRSLLRARRRAKRVCNGEAETGAVLVHPFDNADVIGVR